MHHTYQPNRPNIFVHICFFKRVVFHYKPHMLYFISWSTMHLRAGSAWFHRWRSVEPTWPRSCQQSQKWYDSVESSWTWLSNILHHWSLSAWISPLEMAERGVTFFTASDWDFRIWRLFESVFYSHVGFTSVWVIVPQWCVCDLFDMNIDCGGGETIRHGFFLLLWFLRMGQCGTSTISFPTTLEQKTHDRSLRFGQSLVVHAPAQAQSAGGISGAMLQVIAA